MLEGARNPTNPLKEIKSEKTDKDRRSQNLISKVSSEVTCHKTMFAQKFCKVMNDSNIRPRFVEWAQNEIAVVPDFYKRILFSDEVHFWLNGYVNKQNCHIWSEANPQVYVETPLHPEKLTVWCALWAGGILLQKRGRPQRYSQW
ncbi:transposable element Tc3 transposase [Trichonephila clavipes]|nr:transposable element Tc3 transposase [Trichonephila clavipes]